MVLRYFLSILISFKCRFLKTIGIELNRIKFSGVVFFDHALAVATVQVYFFICQSGFKGRILVLKKTFLLFFFGLFRRDTVLLTLILHKIGKFCFLGAFVVQLCDLMLQRFGIANGYKLWSVAKILC